MSTIWDPSAHRETFIFGLDVGQQMDHSALAAVAKVHIKGDTIDPRTKQLAYAVEYHIKHLVRWPLQTPFHAVVADTVRLRADRALCGHFLRPDGSICWQRAEVALDATGVGSPLVEMFQRNHGVSVTPVVITSGAEVHTGARYKVPKQDLIGALSVGFEQRQIRIAAGLDLADTLLKELQDYRATTKAATGRTSYDAKPGSHDDLLIAVSLAVWRHAAGPSPPVIVRYVA